MVSVRVKRKQTCQLPEHGGSPGHRYGNDNRYMIQSTDMMKSKDIVRVTRHSVSAKSPVRDRANGSNSSPGCKTISTSPTDNALGITPLDSYRNALTGTVNKCPLINREVLLLLGISQSPHQCVEPLTRVLPVCTVRLESQVIII